MSTKEKTIAAIKRFEDGTAPLVLQEAFSSVERLGKLFASISEPSQVQIFSDRFLSDFSDAELEKICGNPMFIMALAAMLNCSLIAFDQELV